MNRYDEIHLSELKDGETARAVKIDCDGALKARLNDLGLVEGTHIQRLYSAFCSTPIAFCLKGAVIALRRCDCDKITVVKMHNAR